LVAIGSMPLLMMASRAAGEARNLMPIPDGPRRGPIRKLEVRCELFSAGFRVRAFHARMADAMYAPVGLRTEKALAS
jgi:hypothetical protein